MRAATAAIRQRTAGILGAGVIRMRGWNPILQRGGGFRHLAGGCEHRLRQHAAEIAIEHHHIERLQRSRDLGQQVIEFADLGIGEVVLGRLGHGKSFRNS